VETEQVTTQTIDERIASALNGDAVSAATITELLRDAEAALEKASDIAAAEHANALNIGCADPNKAEQSSRAAALTRDRLQPVIPRLKHKLAEAMTSERHECWFAE
jgi:hypothetical protein